MGAKTETGSCLVGIKQVRKAIKAGSALRVLYAEDADPMILQPLLAECEASGIPCEAVRSMKELGSRCGIAVGAAAAVWVR